MFKKIFVLTLCALMLLTSAMAEGWTAPAAGDPFGFEGDMDVWMEAYITGGDWTTTRGIGIGSTADDIIAAYGDGYFADGDDMMTYSISGDPNDISSPCIMFTLEDGAVSCIDIYYPTNTL